MAFQGAQIAVSETPVKLSVDTSDGIAGSSLTIVDCDVDLFIGGSSKGTSSTGAKLPAHTVYSTKLDQGECLYAVCDSGVSGIVHVTWQGVAAPATLPPPAVCGAGTEWETWFVIDLGPAGDDPGIPGHPNAPVPNFELDYYIAPGPSGPLCAEAIWPAHDYNNGVKWNTDDSVWEPFQYGPWAPDPGNHLYLIGTQAVIDSVPDLAPYIPAAYVAYVATSGC